MSTIQVCDICGTKTINRVSFRYDRCLDAAGSNSDVVEIFDLCPTCQRDALTPIIKIWMKSKRIDEFEFNKDVINFIKALIKDKHKEK